MVVLLLAKVIDTSFPHLGQVTLVFENAGPLYIYYNICAVKYSFFQ